MIQKERITSLNWESPGEGRYVLYWMQAAQREEYNHALEYAVERANDLSKPVVVVFGLTAAFPQANERHYRFMLEGLRETKEALRGRDAYLEELIVRRELSYNFVYYCHEYGSFECLLLRAKRTLNYHSRYVYSREDFEAARTHDSYSNAAQMEMVLTGKMHGYMRMYWGKEILEWTPSPQEGFKIALYLNNKYELDGRDPNGFSGVD